MPETIPPGKQREEHAMTEAPTEGEPPEQSASVNEPDEPVESASSEAEHPESTEPTAPTKEVADELQKPADERKKVMERWK
jgi:hypothetical protein